jgi:hypothetical protein
MGAGRSWRIAPVPSSQREGGGIIGGEARSSLWSPTWGPPGRRKRVFPGAGRWPMGPQGAPPSRLRRTPPSGGSNCTRTGINHLEGCRLFAGSSVQPSTPGTALPDPPELRPAGSRQGFRRRAVAGNHPPRKELRSNSQAMPKVLPLTPAKLAQFIYVSDWAWAQRAAALA